MKTATVFILLFLCSYTSATKKSKILSKRLADGCEEARWDNFISSKIQMKPQSVKATFGKISVKSFFNELWIIDIKSQPDAANQPKQLNQSNSGQSEAGCI